MYQISEQKPRFVLVSSLIVAIVLLHYGTSDRMMYLHILLQALFFLPVSLSGWWFGKRGGIIAAAVVTVTYIHHAVTVMMPTSALAVSNAIQIFLLFLAGFFTGTYTDLRRSYREATSGNSSHSVMPASMEQKILVYLDRSGVSVNAVNYLANLFRRGYNAAVTLLYVSRSQAATSENGPDDPESKKSATQIIEAARNILLQAGCSESNIETRLVHAQDMRTSDIVLMEQQSGNHSAITVGRHSISRAEEFLFGSVAIRLARKSPCPVWIIGDTSTTEITTQRVPTVTDKDSAESQRIECEARTGN